MPPAEEFDVFPLIRAPGLPKLQLARTPSTQAGTTQAEASAARALELAEKHQIPQPAAYTRFAEASACSYPLTQSRYNASNIHENAASYGLLAFASVIIRVIRSRATSNRPNSRAFQLAKA